MNFPNVDDGFGHWLAGFIDGEGSFGIYPRSGSPGYQPVFSLSLRDDDGPILYEIVGRTQIGSVCQRPRRAVDGRANNGQVAWQARGLADVRRLVALLDRYPLRAKKARDYAIWRDAVAMWERLRRERLANNGPVGFKPVDWSEMAELQAKLTEVRAYESPYQ